MKQAPLRGDQADEIVGYPADARVGQDDVERFDLLGGRKHRALHQPFKVWALGDQRVESGQRVGHGLGLAIVLGERKQGRRVTSGYAGNDRVFLRHARHLARPSSPLRAAAPKPRQPQEFVMISRLKCERYGRPDPKAGVA